MLNPSGLPPVPETFEWILPELIFNHISDRVEPIWIAPSRDNATGVDVSEGGTEATNTAGYTAPCSSILQYIRKMSSFNLVTVRRCSLLSVFLTFQHKNFILEKNSIAIKKVSVHILSRKNEEKENIFKQKESFD